MLIVQDVSPPTNPFAVTAPEVAPNEYLFPFDAVEPGSEFVTVNLPFDTDTLIPVPATTDAAPTADAVALSIPIVTLPELPPPFIGCVTPTLVISPCGMVGKFTKSPAPFIYSLELPCHSRSIVPELVTGEFDTASASLLSISKPMLVTNGRSTKA